MVVRYGEKNGGRGQVSGNYTSCKQLGPIGRQRKAGNDSKLDDKGLSSKEMWGKVGVSQVQK